MTEYGWLSLLPALLCLSMAFYTRKVLLSLAFGVLSGALIISGGNPLNAVIFIIEQELFVQIAKPFNSQIILITILISGFIALVEGSGGFNAFGKLVSGSIKGPIKTQVAAWFGGLVIFFSDSGHILILGPIFQPLFKQAKVCREKLAYVLDATCAPVCALIPFISWGIYSMSLIQAAYESVGLAENSFSVFIKALPFQFYSILSILTVLILILSKRDFGFMNRCQKMCEEAVEVDVSPDLPGHGDAKARVVLIPMAILFTVLIAGFIYFYVTMGTLPGAKIRTILIMSYTSATFAAALLIRKEKTARPLKTMYLAGISRIAPILAIILLAWSLGDICDKVGTGRYLSSFIDAGFPTYLYPAIVFLVGSVISFATGTSWGTFGILMPIAVPIAYAIGAPMLVTVGAVLSGGVFGDHCSPISDTTILSSMATNCVHTNHVNTQIPYAVSTALCACVAFVIAGMTESYWALAIGALLILPVSYVLQETGKTIKKFVPGTNFLSS